jgi:hypothetical protein
MPDVTCRSVRSSLLCAGTRPASPAGWRSVRGVRAVRRQDDRVRCVRFWCQITRGAALRVGGPIRQAPFVPKPGHLTRSPCLELLELSGYMKKQVLAQVRYALLAIINIAMATLRKNGLSPQLNRPLWLGRFIAAHCPRAIFCFLPGKHGQAW